MNITESRFCTECGRNFQMEDLLQFQQHLVCAECKPGFAQRLRQGVALSRSMKYGGFWIRFVARLLDGVIMGGTNFAIGLLFAALFRNSALAGISVLLGLLIGFTYEVWFVARFGATPGKMIFRLKIVTPDGGPISTGRAIARYFGYWLDAITLAIGYVIAAFDDQKRALHDHICATRVIHDQGSNAITVP